MVSPLTIPNELSGAEVDRRDTADSSFPFIGNTECIWVRRNTRRDKIKKHPISRHSQKIMPVDGT